MEYEVIITPLLKDVDRVIKSGADIVAYDATNRKRPVPTKEIVSKIKNANRLAMADCANLNDARNALDEGADIIGTTLSGYIGIPVKDTYKPDINLIRKFKKLDCFVMAEGRYNSPLLAKKQFLLEQMQLLLAVLLLGLITLQSGLLRMLSKKINKNSLNGIALDFGQTKISIGIITNSKVIKTEKFDCNFSKNPKGYINQIEDIIQNHYSNKNKIGIAISGRVDNNGNWYAVNKKI